MTNGKKRNLLHLMKGIADGAQIQSENRAFKFCAMVDNAADKKL